MVYKESARDVQPDGRLRLSLLSDAPQGTTQYNDFFQRVGPYFVVLRTRLPVDAPAQLRTLGRVVNTFDVSTEAAWRSASQETGAAGATDVVGFASLHSWVDRAGGFQIAGQIVNNGGLPLEFVRIQAQLYDAENRLLVEQDDFVSSDLIQPGEYTPFSLVFSDGLPVGTVRYDLHVVARYASFTLNTFYGAENFAITSSAEFDENGLLAISGQVRNEGDQAADLVKVIVTVFDDQRRVIGTSTTLVAQQRLAPGETSPFEVTFTELGGVADTFLVTTQAVIAE